MGHGSACMADFSATSDGDGAATGSLQYNNTGRAINAFRVNSCELVSIKAERAHSLGGAHLKYIPSKEVQEERVLSEQPPLERIPIPAADILPAAVAWLYTAADTKLTIVKANTTPMMNFMG